MTTEINAVTIHIPVTFKRRGGRKLVITPEGAVSPVATPKIDDTVLKILVKAHRWRRRIESGVAASVTDLAEQEKVTVPYVSKILAFTCLAPDIVAAILDGRQPRGLSANRMLQNVPEAWDEQRKLWEFTV
jgi:hypothetical protein